MREYTNKLLALVDEGIIDAKQALNLALGVMSEDDVKDFCLSEYSSLFDKEEDEEEDEESSDYILTYEDNHRSDDEDVYANAADLYVDPRDDEDGRLDSQANHDAMVDKCNAPYEEDLYDERDE